MTIPISNYSDISHTISHALRHEPWLYELELDEEGWVSIESLLSSLQQEKQWELLTKQDILEMIKHSSKQRHEVVGEKIRALYCHSIPGKLIKLVTEAPEYLYHGTSPDSIPEIKKFGLLPMQRQFVDLSVDITTAQTSRETEG